MYLVQQSEETMNTLLRIVKPSLLASLAIILVVAAGCATYTGMTGGVKISLDGNHEVPPVSTAANGAGTIVVAADKTVSGSVTTTGIEGKAAHIHIGMSSTNGPVIVPLSKTADNTWSVPAGARFTDEQYAAYIAGNLYINVHSAAHPGGEIRGQLTPK
jgi:hypothetical protein